MWRSCALTILWFFSKSNGTTQFFLEGLKALWCIGALDLIFFLGEHVLKENSFEKLNASEKRSSGNLADRDENFGKLNYIRENKNSDILFSENHFFKNWIFGNKFVREIVWHSKESHFKAKFKTFLLKMRILNLRLFNNKYKVSLKTFLS